MLTLALKKMPELKMRLPRESTGNDFYTPGGLQVYFKDNLLNDIDVESVVSRVEATLPDHLRSEVDMIVIGHFDEFDERSINAFYDSGALYVSNVQTRRRRSYMMTWFMKSLTHLEGPYGYEIYGDEEVKNEFLLKREHLSQHSLESLDLKLRAIFF